MIDEAKIAPALDDVRALVQADGGDMLLERVDPAANSVSLRLVLEDASCEECVMPREFLEQIALDMLRKQAPDLAAVSIDDPREHPDYVPKDH